MEVWAVGAHARLRRFSDVVIIPQECTTGGFSFARAAGSLPVAHSRMPFFRVFRVFRGWCCYRFEEAVGTPAAQRAALSVRLSNARSTAEGTLTTKHTKHTKTENKTPAKPTGQNIQINDQLGPLQLRAALQFVVFFVYFACFVVHTLTASQTLSELGWLSTAALSVRLSNARSTADGILTTKHTKHTKTENKTPAKETGQNIQINDQLGPLQLRAALQFVVFFVYFACFVVHSLTFIQRAQCVLVRVPPGALPLTFALYFGGAALCLLQQCIDLAPELGESFLFVRGQFGQGGGVADAGQVGVGFPVLERLGDGLPRLRWAGVQEL